MFKKLCLPIMAVDPGGIWACIPCWN